MNNPTCRICLEEDSSYNLISPCDCRGTAQWIHSRCFIAEQFAQSMTNKLHFPGVRTGEDWWYNLPAWSAHCRVCGGRFRAFLEIAAVVPERPPLKQLEEVKVNVEDATARTANQRTPDLIDQLIVCIWLAAVVLIIPAIIVTATNPPVDGLRIAGLLTILFAANGVIIVRGGRS